MGLSFLEIESVISELQPLSETLLKEIYQPTPSELVIALRGSGKTTLLLISIHPRFSRLHLIETRPPNPQKPFPFQMACRKELTGRLLHLTQVDRDRVVKLSFQGVRQRSLIAELTGRHGNIFLLDEQDRILTTMRRPSHQARDLSPGGEYVPLPPSPAPPRVADRFSTPVPGQSIQEAVQAYFAREETCESTESLRQRLRSTLHRQLKRLERRKTDLESDLDRAEQAERHRRYGDILQIHLRNVPRGRDYVVLPNPFEEEEPPIEIPLDPQLDAVGNAQRHYRLYRKFDASIPVVLERMESVEQQITRLTQLEFAVESAKSLEELEIIQRENKIRRLAIGGGIRKSDTPLVRKPFFRYANEHGFEIWVGRNSRDNDNLTFREARGNDFWLHVRGRPGAHVVIPARERIPDLETLLDAGCLALKQSGFSFGDRAEVVYTRVKYVRRIPGGQPGLVTYSQDKTLFIELARERIGSMQRIDLPDE